MKKCFLLCFILMACASGNKNMTADIFQEIETGITEKVLKEKVGSPYTVKDLGNGEKEYEYIQRVVVSDRNFETVHYLFIIKDGKVTSKKIVKTQEKPQPLLERNAYDLQTSFKAEEKSVESVEKK
jgi:hypothetical protein